jgi:hypothetical protein
VQRMSQQLHYKQLVAPLPDALLVVSALQRESVLWDSRVSVFSDKGHSICVREQVAGTTQVCRTSLS